MQNILPLIGLYTTVLVFMLVLSVILYRNNPNKHFKNLMHYWLAIVSLFVWVTATSAAPLNIVATNLLLWYWNIKIFLVILGESTEIDIWRKWYFPINCVGYGISIVAFILNANFYWLTVPIILALDAMMISSLCIVWKKWKDISIFNKVLWLCVLSFTIHMNDYPYTRQHQDRFLVFAFTYFVFNILAFAITLPMVILDNVHRETRRHLDALVKERSEQLIQQSKMASLGQMAGGIAHEINNPLMIITGSLFAADNVLESQKDADIDRPALRKYFDKITKSSERIKVVVNALINYAGEGKGGVFSRQSLQEIINSAIIFCEEKLKTHRIDLILPENSSQTVVNVDPSLTAQVVLNLINNAVDAIDKMENKWIKIIISATKQNVVLSVIDCGPGIPANIAARIFDPFFTTKEVGSGSGLGLSTAKGMMRRQNGDLVYDATSKNTKFDVIFPI